MSGQVKKREDLGDPNTQSVLWEETVPATLVNDFKVCKVNGIVYAEFRFTDPTQPKGITCSDQASSSQQSEVQGRLVFRAAMSPEAVTDLVQQLQEVENEMFGIEENGYITIEDSLESELY